MIKNTDKKQNISRKKFLRLCGSFIAGGSILGLTGILLQKTSLLRTSITRQEACSDEAKRSNDACNICHVKNCPLRKGVDL